ncbi:MAG: hypothetical protein SFX72_08265 [Isosphaeraceae bacterium]|nr:hypothetical protein [Isosphaeraceae bacterium]
MQAQERLENLAFPDRDPSLRALIARLSEPDAGKAADNFVSNEDSTVRVALDLERLAPAGSVYLGVGPDQNFTAIAHARPRLAFILDRRRRNLRLHLLHKGLLALANDRIDYLRRLTAREPVGALGGDATPEAIVDAFRAARFDRSRLDVEIARVREVVEPLGILEPAEFADLATIQARLAGPGLDARFLALPIYPTSARAILTRAGERRPHWLASSSTFARVRDLERSDRLVPLTADFAGPTALRRTGEWLRAHRLEVGVFYVSDVEFFLLRAGRFADYVANLSALPWAAGAVIVRTSTREIDHPERRSGESSTTVIRAAERFLARAERGEIASVDDLFEREGGRESLEGFR